MEAMILVALGAVLGAGSVALRVRVLRRALSDAHACAREAEARLEAERAASTRIIGELRRAGEEKIALVAGSREELAREMQGIAAEVMQSATGELVKLAGEARTADREASQAAVAPIAGHLERVQRQVEALERDRRLTQGSMREMLDAVGAELGRLRRETGSLVTALRRPQVRGAWGEMQLRNCAKAANMTANVDFHEQLTVGGEDGRLRPDMVVHLPSEADVVVDAKVPLDAYLAALDASDDAGRDEQLDRHARQLRSHIDRLAGKAYHAQFADSPEFVVCFIPNEAIYCAALDRDPSLLQHGAERRVLLATPSTLIALLHACASAWRHDRLAESAREVAAAARELHRRTATFLEPYARLGRQLGSAMTAYNDSVASMEARVLPQLRRIEEAGAASEKPLPAVRPLETPPRALAAAAGLSDGVAYSSVSPE